MPSTDYGFAQREMSRCGWSEGKGLGKSENGMKDAIKVKLKNNTGGLGHDEGTQFTFHWWDYVFNKAANSFKVSEGDEGDLIEKCEGKKITPVLISNKKPSKYVNADLLYGTFVKAGTYNADADKKDLIDTFSDDDSSDESSDEEDKKMSLNDTLERTFKKTGLTGHKAARHGHNLCGKLQRIENQEKAQLPSNGSEVSDEKDKKCKTDTNSSSSDDLSDNELKELKSQKSNDSLQKKKKKKKKKKRKTNETDAEVVNELDACEVKDKENEKIDELQKIDEIKENNTVVVTDIQKKKKKKKKKEIVVEEQMEVQDKKHKLADEDISENQPKKKKKKKKKGDDTV